jgi:hypothetical protein
MIAPDNTVGDGSREAERSTAPGPKNSEQAKPTPSSAGLANGAAAAVALRNVEDDQAYDRLLARLRRERKPAGPTEELLVEQLASCGLQLQQAPALKRKLLLSTAMAPGVLSRLTPQICMRIYMAGLEPYLSTERPITKKMVQAAALLAPSLAQMVGEPADGSPCVTLADLTLLLKFQKYERELAASFSSARKELDCVQEGRRRQSEEARSVRSRSPKSLRGRSDGLAGGEPTRKRALKGR